MRKLLAIVLFVIAMFLFDNDCLYVESTLLSTCLGVTFLVFSAGIFFKRDVWLFREILKRKGVFTQAQNYRVVK